MRKNPLFGVQTQQLQVPSPETSFPMQAPISTLCLEAGGDKMDPQLIYNMSRARIFGLGLDTRACQRCFRQAPTPCRTRFQALSGGPRFTSESRFQRSRSGRRGTSFAGETSPDDWDVCSGCL